MRRTIIVSIVLLFTIYQLSECQLTSMSVKEVSCPADMTTLNFLTFTGPYAAYVPFLIFANVGPFLPMASQFTYRRYAEVFLGQAANTQSELDQMGYRGFTFYNWGYGKLQFAQGGVPYIPPGHLFPSNQYIINFPATPGTDRNGTDVSLLSYIYAGLVWTDGWSTVLVVDCMNGDALDWAVYSTSPNISSATQALVLELIQPFGFDPTKAEYMLYSSLTYS